MSLDDIFVAVELLKPNSRLESAKKWSTEVKKYEGQWIEVQKSVITCIHYFQMTNK